MRGDRWECEAYQVSDQMNCARCGFVWDVNDPDPPKCSPGREEVRKQYTPPSKPLDETRDETSKKNFAKLREALDLPPRVP